MFIIRMRYGDTYTNIEFPCTNNTLYAELAEVHVSDDEKEKIKIFVEEIDRKSLKSLENDFVDPDELNRLAENLESFDKDELEKYETVAEEFNVKGIRELINLTYNMHYYTLISDVSDAERVGKKHCLTREGGVANDDERDFAKIGKELINSGKGRLTSSGILFVNDDLPYERPYLGNTIPNMYYYSDRPLCVEISYNGQSSFVHLPDVEMAIGRAVTRIGAECIEQCDLRVDDYDYGIEQAIEYTGNMHATDDELHEIINDIMDTEGLYFANNVLTEINKLPKEDWARVVIASKYAERSDSESIIQITKNINCFKIYGDVSNCLELGEAYINNDSEIYIPEDIEEFFDFERFGEKLLEDLEGKFMENNMFVGMEGKYIDEILSHTEEQNMGIQGM